VTAPVLRRFFRPPSILVRGALSVLVLGLVPARAGAWGGDGHRIVGEIAWRHLTPRAKREVTALLPPGPYETLAEACTWADREGRRVRRYRPLHYVNLDRAGAAGRGSNAACPGGACVTAAIRSSRATLVNRGASRREKIEALRLFAHFVGDVHQPLHVVATADSSGGNKTVVLYRGRRHLSLHRLWDSELLADGMDRLYRKGGTRRGNTKDLWRRLAADLDAAAGPRERRRWEAATDPEVWAGESLAIARGPLVTGDGGRPLAPGAILPDDYEDRAFPVVEERLTAAGIRLAFALNAIFDR
jgi:nuclease S1